jgi:AraC-like DNA-binding protein
MLSIKTVKLSTKQELYTRLQWTKDFINENYAQHLTIGDLADLACLSPFHFQRLFKQVFNLPPYQYIKARRIEKARELLVKGIPVHTVCRSVGWEDTSSFVRLFKQKFSVTPKQYSTLHR